MEILDNGEARKLVVISNPEDDEDVPMKFEVESLSKPEIVATGSMARKRETKSEGALPIALYPRDKARQGRILNILILFV